MSPLTSSVIVGLLTFIAIMLVHILYVLYGIKRK